MYISRNYRKKEKYWYIKDMFKNGRKRINFREVIKSLSIFIYSFCKNICETYRIHVKFSKMNFTVSNSYQNEKHILC